MHMSFSGVDYYGADIGGFRREGVDGNNDDERNKYEMKCIPNVCNDAGSIHRYVRIRTMHFRKIKNSIPLPI